MPVATVLCTREELVDREDADAGEEDADEDEPVAHDVAAAQLRGRRGRAAPPSRSARSS